MTRQPPPHSFRHHLLGPLALAWLACLPLQARATTWLCGLDATATSLVCVADADPAAGEPDEAAAQPVATGQVKGTRFPLDPERVWRVPLWTPPTEPAWLQLLAQSTLCWRSPGCEVVVHPGSLAELARPQPGRRVGRAR